MVLHLLKPFVYAWAGLTFIDDLSVVFKVVRLIGTTIVPTREANAESACNLCDDIMESLLKGTEGVESVPCSWMCLGTPKCTKMCKSIKEVYGETGDFPCVAAGYCVADDEADGGLISQVDCKKGPLLSCEPKKFCRKSRPKFGYKYTCELKPGLGRWMHMKNTAVGHTAAMAAALLERKHCGEPDAGPYCIARPSGSGRIAEFLGWALSILYGGYQSIIAIETPGGDDDQNWLTFWVMFVASMILEQTFARVLLSNFRFYYQAKLVTIVWLLFFNGARNLYRRLRMRMSYWSPSFANMLDSCHESNTQIQLDSMIDIGGSVVTDKIARLELILKSNPSRRNSDIFPNSETKRNFWEYDYTDTKRGIDRMSLTAEETLYQLSAWMLGSEGMKELEDKLDNNSVAMLLERAAPVVSFQPKFLNILLIGTKRGPRGRLPAMDSNGKTDCYIRFSLVGEGPHSSRDSVDSLRRQKNSNTLKSLNQTLTSRIAYRTLEPEWNQILEMPLTGGTVETSGNYRNSHFRCQILLVEAWDADCGKWGIALEVFRILTGSLVCALVAAYVLGVIDFVFNETLTTEQWWWKTAFIALACYVVLGLTLSWMMSVVLRADDEYIGSSVVPLVLLSDHRAHSLCLMLRDKRDERGILRVKLCLSEN
eukprot:jgi/Psemu1/284248/fgenesh1_pg.47_\